MLLSKRRRYKSRIYKVTTVFFDLYKLTLLVGVNFCLPTSLFVLSLPPALVCGHSLQPQPRHIMKSFSSIHFILSVVRNRIL